MIERNLFHIRYIIGHIVFYVLILLMGFLSVLSAQDTVSINRYIHMEGSLGQKKNLILDLHQFGDSIYGSYYGQLEGQLHYFSGKATSKSGFWAIKKNGDSLIAEFVSPNIISGYIYNRKDKSKTSFLFSETDHFGSMLFKAYRNSRNYAFSDKPLYPPYKVDLLFLYPDSNVNKIVEDSVQDYIIGYYFGQNIVFNTSENMLKFMSDHYYQNYFAHYKTNAFDYRSSLLRWSSLQDVQVIFNENFVLSFCMKQTTSNWLAETLWEKIYFVINLKTGNKITPNDIFIAGYKEKLKNLITERIKQQFNITGSLQNEGFYKATVSKYDNLFVTREGVGFHYNPGDIAPWIYGEIDVFFKFDELKDILLPKGIVYTLVQ